MPWPVKALYVTGPIKVLTWDLVCACFVLFLSAVITFSPSLTAQRPGAAQKHDMYILNELLVNISAYVVHIEKRLPACSHYSITERKTIGN